MFTREYDYDPEPGNDFTYDEHGNVIYGIGFVNTTFHHEHAILACLFLGLYLSYTRTFFKN
jgi:hypothetical protein